MSPAAPSNAGRACGTLYVVSTPIGNLEDITLRALRVLSEVRCIAAEDTRHTRKLLSHHELSTPMTSYHEHNERTKAPELIGRILEGDDIALVSDGGTPNISDPGYSLIGMAIEEEVAVVPVPGPSALIAAASVAGMPVHDFFFAGFCPAKPGKRRRRIESLGELRSTVIFYESPHRLVAFLRDAEEVLGARNAAVAREMTKLHEETVRGTIPELRAHFEAHPPRGEMTVLIAAGGEDA